MHLIQGRYGACAVAWKDRIYVLGGSGKEEYLGNVEAINYRLGKVAVLSGKLLPRRYHAAQVIGDSVYVAGGYGQGGLAGELERLELATGKVEKRRPMPTPRSACAAVVANGLLWVVGGSTASGYTGALEIYDPRRDTWESGPPLSKPRECPAVYKDGLIHVIGGYAGEAGTRFWDTYSVTDAHWTRQPALPVPMSAHHMATVGDTLYVFGDYSVMDRVLACDLIKQAWYRPRLPEPFQSRRHAAVAALEEQVYVIGGAVASSNSNLDTIQVFRLPG